MGLETGRVDRVTVIGAGMMGHGIAQVAATAGFDVVLYDVSEAALGKARSDIGASLQAGVTRGKVTQNIADEAQKRVHYSTDLAASVRGVDLVIEAAPENPALKATLFRDISTHAPNDAVLATNTSSLSITEIAAHARQPAHVCGMHFFNPPYVLTLLELVRAEQTNDATLALARKVAARMGRDVIVVRDTPGFATSRLGVVLGLEAIRMVQEGVASPADIDRAMELGYRHAMGPLRLTDLIGLDTRLAIADYLYKEVGGEQFRAPQLLRRMVRAGKLGKKSGEGFYRW